jgi:cobalt-precorrin-5B (C1)-methyltransferase
MPTKTAYDLTAPAANGLRRGVTTGTCATAAVKAAVIRLLLREEPERVKVTLPDGEHFVEVAISRLLVEDEGGSGEATGALRAEVIKDAGDDPDQTHRATIFAIVRRNTTGDLRFLAGRGVGTVTQPGLQIPVGQAAINPVPRAMMRQAVGEVLAECGLEFGGAESLGFDLEIGCENGEQIALRTFNPRLGVIGGISILGTTGIVEPKSLASFKASIEVYIRVALGHTPEGVPPREIVLAPGNLGQKFARQSLDVPLFRVVQMSNFLGFALQCVARALAENSTRLPVLWLVGHPGKLAKVLNDAWDTHSSESASATTVVCEMAHGFGFHDERLAASTTVEGIINLLDTEPAAPLFWQRVEGQVANLVHPKLPGVDEVRVRLFRMDGTPLGVSDSPKP